MPCTCPVRLQFGDPNLCIKPVNVDVVVTSWRGLQIIPTVNAGSGDAEGEKRVASMLKHFRGLVDETAAKSRFLSAFHRKRASISIG